MQSMGIIIQEGTVKVSEDSIMFNNNLEEAFGKQECLTLLARVDLDKTS